MSHENILEEILNELGVEITKLVVEQNEPKKQYLVGDGISIRVFEWENNYFIISFSDFVYSVITKTKYRPTINAYKSIFSKVLKVLNRYGYKVVLDISGANEDILQAHKEGMDIMSSIYGMKEMMEMYDNYYIINVIDDVRILIIDGALVRNYKMEREKLDAFMKTKKAYFQ